MADNTAIDVKVAEHILNRMGEIGQPPEFGIQLVNVGNEEYLEVLQRQYLRRLLTEARGSAFKLVQGYFGGGKTHFLHCVRDLAWNENFLTSMVSLSRQECPFDDPYLVYKAVVGSIMMPPSDVMGYAVRGLPDVLRSWADNNLADMTDEAFKTWFKGTALRIPVRNHNFRRAVAEFLSAYRNGDDQAEVILEAWLYGEAVPHADLKRYGVYGIIDRSNALQSLCSMAQLFKGYGFPGVVMMFDEVDRNLSLISGKKLRTWVDNLRQVIDMCGGSELPGVLFLYAVPPEFMRNVVPEYPALDQRLRCPLSMSMRSPQSALIDLENLSMTPDALLKAIGLKLLDVAQVAWGWDCNRALQEKNAAVLADCMSRYIFESGHRRQFVKVWISFLQTQRFGDEYEMTPEEAESLMASNDRFGGSDPEGAYMGGEDSDQDDAFDDEFRDF
ncbi:DUF2791 family P-loop domain-containing protein [bacterium]|nr:DUF2791 family P-loop domain-containing protein [bacterium]